MCGIAGFLSNRRWVDDVRLDWLDDVSASLRQARETDFSAIEAALDVLAERFYDLMSFGTHLAAVTKPAVAAGLRSLADRAGELESALRAGPSAREPRVERLAERLRDYGWQLSTEVLGNVDRTLALLPDGNDFNRAQHMVAWGIGQVIENLDRLEVRGRDSAGIAVQLTLDGPHDSAALRRLQARVVEAGRSFGDMDMGVALHLLSDGRITARFTYKTVLLIGRLGDNGQALRGRMRGDALLWDIAAEAAQMSAIAHTRWASHGAISYPNCHPLSGSLAGEDAAALSPDADAVGVLNGDIDNYRSLRDALAETGCHLAPEVTTDAKIIPTLFRAQSGNEDTAERFLSVLRGLDGSMAIVLQHPAEPDRLYLGQKGSGQSLFLGKVHDGLIIASENYGLAPRARHSIALSQVRNGGLQVTLSTRADEQPFTARTAEDGLPTTLKTDPIEIFSRDIFRGEFDHFFEKEVHESAASVRKTLVGRYRRAGRRASFDMGEGMPWGALRDRVTDPNRPAIRRIYVTGQGTAAIAAMGVAYLLRQALGTTGIHVESEKASELSANLEGRNLDDALVIAISQSGTTTDTNRTVDLARAAGAWIHGIVNRRNSDLVRKSDSHLFTSDGRDIEMAVASTKAFYAQVAAGKLTALCLADALGCLDKAQIHDELVALESLPARIQEVLDEEEAIAAVAERFAPQNRYWACVGNGPNRIAAEEIRIKLSELCYKSIPVDYTEDKKHIDLSTEPLTIVIANDLPALLAQDTAKEVAIFKAHAGKPIVIAAKGETCFDSYAEAVIKVPSVGAGLDFILATVAGHLWGFHAARAIDRRSAAFKELASVVDERAAQPGTRLDDVADRIVQVLEKVAAGDLDAALPPKLTARLALLQPKLRAWHEQPAPARAALAKEAEQVLRHCFEETSRPIDTIRHQAKTVTVGISRPGREVSPAIAQALSDLGVALASLAEHDRQVLLAISPILTGIRGGIYYRIAGEGADGAYPLATAMKIGASAERRSSYDAVPKAATGSKRRALRLGRAALAAGRAGQENLLLVPVFDTADWRAEGLVLLHADIAPQCSLQQKTQVLKELRLYEDLFDAFHEAEVQSTSGHPATALDFSAYLEQQSPRDLLFGMTRVAAE